MKDKCLLPLRVLNQTYSVEEIDIDFNRPKIDDTNELAKQVNQLTGIPRPVRQFLIEKSRVTITKHTISKSEYKTVTEGVPKIVVTDWDKKGQDIKEIEFKPSIEHATPDKQNHQDIIEFNKQVSSKIVEEKTFDQFKDIDKFEHTPEPMSKKVYPKTPANDKKDFTIVSASIRCKCCSSKSPDSCSRGSYVIVKNSQPANIQFEQFDSRLDETRDDSVCNMSHAENMEREDYYLVNPKLKIDDTNNNESSCPNRNIETTKLNNFENDEYHLANLKNIVTPRQSDILIEEPIESAEKARNNDPKASLSISNYLSGHSIAKETPQSCLKDAVKKNLNQEFTPVADTPNQIRIQDVETPIKDTNEPEYLYLYISGTQLNEIFTQGKIGLEKTIQNGNIVDGILLLSLPPSSSDSELLNELYGPGVPVDKFRVQCCIKLNRLLFEKSKYLHQVSNHKYICTKRIEFGNKFPKHEFRYRFNKQ